MEGLDCSLPSEMSFERKKLLSATERQVMVGVFEDENHAKKAIDDLRSLGFSDDQIGIAVRGGGLVAHCILGNLVNMGVSEEEAIYYKREFEAGHVVVAVKFNCSKQEVINLLLSKSGPEQLNISINGISIKKTGKNQLEDFQDCSPSITLDSPESQETNSIGPDDMSSLRKLLKDAGLDYLL
jgi:hypothetical protein